MFTWSPLFPAGPGGPTGPFEPCQEGLYENEWLVYRI